MSQHLGKEEVKQVFYKDKQRWKMIKRTLEIMEESFYAV